VVSSTNLLNQLIGRNLFQSQLNFFGHFLSLGASGGFQKPRSLVYESSVLPLCYLCWEVFSTSIQFFSAIFLSLGATDGFQTLALRIMSQEFYHSVTTTETFFKVNGIFLAIFSLGVLAMGFKPALWVMSQEFFHSYSQWNFLPFFLSLWYRWDSKLHSLGSWVKCSATVLPLLRGIFNFSSTFCHFSHSLYPQWDSNPQSLGYESRVLPQWAFISKSSELFGHFLLSTVSGGIQTLALWFMSRVLPQCYHNQAFISKSMEQFCHFLSQCDSGGIQTCALWVMSPEFYQQTYHDWVFYYKVIWPFWHFSLSLYQRWDSNHRSLIYEARVLPQSYHYWAFLSKSIQLFAIFSRPLSAMGFKPSLFGSWVKSSVTVLPQLILFSK